MAFFGLAWGRKRATKMWEARKQLWERNGMKVEESLEGPPLFRVRKITLTPIPGVVEAEQQEIKAD
jgi:hypothetical protein